MTLETSYRLVSDAPGPPADDGPEEPFLDIDDSPQDTVLGLSLRSPIFFAIGGILLIFSFICGSLLHPVSLSQPSQNLGPHHPDFEKLQALIPSLSPETKQFEFDWAFAGDPSNNVTDAWLSLIPKGQGVIRLPFRHQYNSTIYNIAGFHSFHCLYTLRESFFGFYRMSTEPSEFKVSGAAEMLKHGRHCIEYLRQVLICNPDVNLEPVDGVTGHLRTWGYQRQCTDFSALSNWARDMRASNNVGILV